MSANDRLTLCAQGVFGKPVVTNEQLRSQVRIPCPASREEIIRVAESAQYGYWLFENERWVAVMWPRQIDHPHRWFTRRLQVTEAVDQLKQYSEVKGSRWLTAGEVKQIHEAVRRQVRTPSVGVVKAGSLSYVAEIEMRLVLDCHRFKDDEDSIVGVWGARNGYSRLIYGEKIANGFALLWDSPLIPARAWTLEYNDMDGDGIEEILVHSRFGSKRDVALSVFNTKGEELSRQSDDCLMEWGCDDEEGCGCPIVGLDASFERQPGGKKDIVLQLETASDVAKIERYRLVAGRYVKDKARATPTGSSSK
jgi:hypothetical protein